MTPLDLGHSPAATARTRHKSRVKRAKNSFIDVTGGEGRALFDSGRPIRTENICRAAYNAGCFQWENIVQRRDGKKLAALLAMTA